MGGIHPTMDPLGSINTEGVSAICVGEGEFALLEFIDSLKNGKDVSHIKNIWIKKGKKIISNDIRPLISDLDSLPFSDRSIFNYQEIINKHGGVVDIMTHRGCPFLCNYCANHKLIRLYKDKGCYVRYRSVDNVMNEIKKILKEYCNIKFITFLDETFTMNKDFLREFSKRYKNEVNIPFLCNGRVNCIDEEIIMLLKDMGCYRLCMGVECGNERIRREVLNRNITNQQIINAFGLAKKHGINTTSFNMIGIPYETEDTIKETIKLNRLIKPTDMFLSIFKPYPGTEAYELCKRNGWMTNIKSTSYFENKYTLNQPTISKDKVELYYKLFRWKVYYPLLSPFIYPLVKIKINGKSIYDLILLPLVKSNKS